MFANAYAPRFHGFNSADFHAWVEVNGKVIDYPIHQLRLCSKFGTGKVKYVPFEEDIQDKLQRRYRVKFEQKYTLLSELQRKGCYTKGKWEAFVVLTPGYCFYRAMVMYDRLVLKGKKPKLVFGSLGFVQEDGRVFYEFG
jgi:hypothetical protein